MKEKKTQDFTNDGFFSSLENTRPFLKMAMEGFSGSGKTFTSAMIAIGLHKHIKSTKPIVWYDTEKALKALKPVFDKNKIKVLTRESRSLADLVKTIQLCESGAADILVIDSITHVWENFTEAYKAQKKRTFLQFQDWGAIKPQWKRDFSDNLVQSKLHIIFTGRAGFEYDNEVNEDTGKKELIKTGVKMKVEGETEYEPDVVVLMDKIKVMDNGKMIRLDRTATIIKDRTTLIDGKVFTNPTYKDFEPAINLLLDGESKDVKVAETEDKFPNTFDDKKKEKEITLEKITNNLVLLFPGSATFEKKMKLLLLEKIFETTSWEEITTRMSFDKVRDGSVLLEQFKPKCQEYLENCGNETIKPDEKQIVALLQEVRDSQSIDTFIQPGN